VDESAETEDELGEEAAAATQPPRKLLDQMIGRDANRKDENASTKDNLQNTLDDIEKHLGLR